MLCCVADIIMPVDGVLILSLPVFGCYTCLSLFLSYIHFSTGWTVYHQTSERVTYKSSSKPRTRFLSGPVSLSICLYLFYFSSITHRSFLFGFLYCITSSSLTPTFSDYCSFLCSFYSMFMSGTFNE